ncbi:MAG: hypothetical protein ABJA94_07640 [Rhodoglobus sp.]
MRRRALSVFALVAVVCLLVSGCGPINAGSAAAHDFYVYMTGQPGVADVQVHASNNLPFQGSADATVVLNKGAGEGTLTTVMNRMAAYLRDDASNVSWTTDAELDGFTVAVSAVDDQNHAIIDLLGQVRAIDGIVGGTIDSETRNRPGNDLVVENSAQFIATLAQLVKLHFTSAVRVSDADSTFAVTSTDDRQMPESEIAAYEAVAAVYRVTGATLAPGSVAVRVAADTDVAAAAALAKSLPGSAGIAFTITGGNVTREGDGDFTLVDTVIARLAGLPDVTAINATASKAKHATLALTVKTIDAIVAIEAVLTELDPQSVLTVNYRSADAVAPGFQIYGPSTRRATYIPIVAELSSGAYISSIEIDADRINIVAGAYDATRMAELAAALKRLLPAGESVRLTNVQGGVNFSFTTGDLIDVPADKSYGDVDATAFVAAWNAAP